MIKNSALFLLGAGVCFLILMNLSSKEEHAPELKKEQPVVIVNEHIEQSEKMPAKSPPAPEEKTDLPEPDYYSKDEVRKITRQAVQKALQANYAVFEEQGEENLEKPPLEDEITLKRRLNTVVNMEGRAIEFNKQKSQIILTPGIYYISGSAPAYCTIYHRLDLVDVSKGNVVLTGTGEQAGGRGMQTRSRLEGIITIKKKTVLELHHYLHKTQTGSGSGIDLDKNQIFARLIVRRIPDGL